MKRKERIVKQALELAPVERADLVDRLISSLDIPDHTIDDVWRREIGRRMEAYRAEKMETASVEEVLEKYRGK